MFSSFSILVGVALAANTFLNSQLSTLNSLFFFDFKFQAKKNDQVKVVISSNIWNKVGSCARNYQKVEMMMNSEKATVGNLRVITTEAINSVHILRVRQS